MDLYVVFADGELNVLPPFDMGFVNFAKMIQSFFEKDSEFIPNMENFIGEKINSISFEFKHDAHMRSSLVHYQKLGM